MNKDIFCIVCTTIPFILLFYNVYLPKIKNKKRRRKFHIIKKTGLKSDKIKQNKKKTKYKLRDLNNVDLTRDYVNACWEELKK